MLKYLRHFDYNEQSRSVGYVMLYMTASFRVTNQLAHIGVFTVYNDVSDKDVLNRLTFVLLALN